jgi:hypothetical protein
VADTPNNIDARTFAVVSIYAALRINGYFGKEEARDAASKEADALLARLGKGAGGEKGETWPRVIPGKTGCWVYRGEDDGDYIDAGGMPMMASSSFSSVWRINQALPSAEVPAWLASHGYNPDGTRKQGTSIDAEAGKKWLEAIEAVREAIRSFDDAMTGSAQYAASSIRLRNAASNLLKLDAKGGAL